MGDQVLSGVDLSEGIGTFWAILNTHPLRYSSTPVQLLNTQRFVIIGSCVSGGTGSHGLDTDLTIFTTALEGSVAFTRRGNFAKHKALRGVMIPWFTLSRNIPLHS